MYIYIYMNSDNVTLGLGKKEIYKIMNSRFIVYLVQ